MKLNQRYNFDEDYVIDVEPMMKTALSNKRAAEEAEKVRLAESKARYDAICIVKTKITDFIDHFLNKPNNDCRHIKYDSLETGDCWHIPDTDLLNYLDPEEVARYIVLNLKAHASVPDEIIIGAATSIGSDLGNITYTPIYKIVKEIESITSSFILADNISKSMKENKSQTTICNNPQGDGLYVSSNSDCPNALAGVQFIDSSHLNGSMSDASYRRYIDDTYYGNTQEVN